MASRLEISSGSITCWSRLSCSSVSCDGCWHTGPMGWLMLALSLTTESRTSGRASEPFCPVPLGSRTPRVFSVSAFPPCATAYAVSSLRSPACFLVPSIGGTVPAACPRMLSSCLLKCWWHLFLHLQHRHLNFCAHFSSSVMHAPSLPLYDTSTCSPCWMRRFARSSTVTFLPVIISRPSSSSLLSSPLKIIAVIKLAFCACLQQL